MAASLAEPISETIENVAPVPLALEGPRLSVLIGDNDRSFRAGCAALLQRDGHSVVAVTRDTVLDLARRRHFDVMLIEDVGRNLPIAEMLRTVLDTEQRPLVIVMSADPTTEADADVLGAGAWEYVAKPFSGTYLRVLIERAMRQLRDRADTHDDVSIAGPSSGVGDAGPLLGISESFRRTLELARKVAATDASVVLIGESGTGKEMFARFIHQHSRRAGHTMMPVNCAALPEALLESEMFGHRRGAFTGADRDKPGLLETAHKGTLFLDELTEMSHPIQAKLLRVLQDGRLRRVGSEEEDREVDVRIISATNQDPEQAVRAGVLRQDLFFRLWVCPIHLPPLRERPEDVAFLAKHFLSAQWTRHRPSRAKLPTLGDEALEELTHRPWRGNVRELENAMERLAVTVEAGATVRPADLPPRSTADGPAHSTPLATPSLTAAPFHAAKEQFMNDFEKAYLTQLAHRSGRNLSQAARIANIDRTTLYRLLEKHGLQRRDFADSTEAA